MNVNDQVEAVVLSVDKDNEKISLGIKQMEPDPWTTIEEKYPPGQVVAGKVRNLTAFGAFVELEEGIDGLVHISDMSWTKRIQHPSEVMKKGGKLEVKILKVDHEHRRISLGYKQLTQDPWPEISRKYAVGTDCLGSISRVLDRGVVVDLDGDIEGFVPTAQLGRKELKDATGSFAEGESIPLQVTELDKNQRKVVLSVIAYYKKRERAEFDEFLAKHEPQPATLGDAMPEELKAQAETTAAPPAKEQAQPEGDAAATETVAKTSAAEDTPVVEQPPAEAAPAVEQPPAEAAPAEADEEAAVKAEVTDAPESEPSAPEDSEEPPKQEE